MMGVSDWSRGQRVTVRVAVLLLVIVFLWPPMGRGETWISRDAYYEPHFQGWIFIDDALTEPFPPYVHILWPILLLQAAVIAVVGRIVWLSFEEPYR